MKNENVHMQAFHRKLDVVLVPILLYSCSETDHSFCEDSPQQDSTLYTWMRVSPSNPQYFFALPPVWRPSSPETENHDVLTYNEKGAWDKKVGNLLCRRLLAVTRTAVVLTEPYCRLSMTA